MKNRAFCVNSEYANPEMRETLGFQNGSKPISNLRKQSDQSSSLCIFNNNLKTYPEI